MNAVKSKVMRCSSYVNVSGMQVTPNGEPLKAVDCFKYLGSQVAADGGYEMMYTKGMKGIKRGER